MIKLLKSIFSADHSSEELTEGNRTNLKHSLNIKFEEKLIPIEFPNVGTYKYGSRTKAK